MRLRSFITQTLLETDFALRHTEVASTVMHVSSVVNNRNSFLSMRLKGRQPSWSESSKTYWVYNLSKAAYKLSVFHFWSPFTVLALGSLRPMIKLPLTEMGKKQTLNQKDKHTQSLSLFISYC